MTRKQQKILNTAISGVIHDSVNEREDHKRLKLELPEIEYLGIWSVGK